MSSSFFTASGSGKLTKTGLATKSRICKTLTEVLNDNGALPYLIQYMEMLDAVHLVQFWLSSESFSTASWSRIRSDAFTKSASKTQNETINSKTKSDSKPPTSESISSTEKVDVGKRDENANNDLSRKVVGNVQTSSAKKDESSTNPFLNDGDGTDNNLSSSDDSSAEKTHNRTKSDTSAMLSKTVKWSDSGSSELGSPGHRRNHSWKGVDTRTGKLCLVYLSSLFVRSCLILGDPLMIDRHRSLFWDDVTMCIITELCGIFTENVSKLSMWNISWVGTRNND